MQWRVKVPNISHTWESKQEGKEKGRRYVEEREKEGCYKWKSTKCIWLLILSLSWLFVKAVSYIWGVFFFSCYAQIAASRYCQRLKCKKCIYMIMKQQNWTCSSSYSFDNEEIEYTLIVNAGRCWNSPSIHIYSKFIVATISKWCH